MAIIENNILIKIENQDIVNGHFSVPHGVTKIDAWSCSHFDYVNQNLLSLDIPDSVIEISEGAFYGCKSLKYLKLPSKIEKIGDTAFMGTNLNKIDYGKHQIEISKPLYEIRKTNGEMLIEGQQNSMLTIIKENNEIINSNAEEINKLFHKITMLDRISIEGENIYSTVYEKLKTLYDKGFRTPSKVFMKVPLEKLKTIDNKFFFNLLTATGIDDDTKGSLLEMVYVLGAFDDDIVTRDGFNYKKDDTKYVQDMNSEVRKNFILDLLINLPKEINEEHYEKVKRYIVGCKIGEYSLIEGKEIAVDYNELLTKWDSYCHDRKKVQDKLSKKESFYLAEAIKNSSLLLINNTLLHAMFDGMDLTKDFDSRFYVFFKNNYQKILANDDYLKMLSSIQRNFDMYYRKLGLSPELVTLEAIIELRKKEPYHDIKPGCYELAREAKSIKGGLGVDEKDYAWYQNEAYPKMIWRKESSIPNLKVTLDDGTNGEFLRLDDINNLLAGEKTNCCQVYDGGFGAGRTSMMHAAFSNNGRIFLVRNKEGEILGQSWCWFNNNTLCFDNFEASSKYKHSTDPSISLNSSFNKYKDSVREVYIEAAKQAIEASQQRIEVLKKCNANTNYESSRIKSVTIGIANDDSGFLNEFTKVHRDRTIWPPRDMGNNLYTDADIQVKIMGEDIKELNGLPTEYIFRDKRRIREYSGESIDEDVVARINEIYKIYYEEKAMNFKNFGPSKKLHDVREIVSEETHVIIGEDYYYLYIEKPNEIELLDLVRLIPRFGDESTTQIIETSEIIAKTKLKGKKIKNSSSTIDDALLVIHEELSISKESSIINNNQTDTDNVHSMSA